MKNFLQIAIEKHYAGEVPTAIQYAQKAWCRCGVVRE
jgi:hypothetical protein